MTGPSMAEMVKAAGVEITEDDCKLEIGDLVLTVRMREKAVRFLAAQVVTLTEKCAELEAELAEKVCELETALKLIPED